MIICILVAVLVGIMFWQPQMSSNYRPEPRIKLTKLQRYVRTIDKLIEQGHYDIVSDLLSRTKYPRDELPWGYWKEIINEEISRIRKESEQLENLRNLEKILGP